MEQEENVEAKGQQEWVNSHRWLHCHSLFFLFFGFWFLVFSFWFLVFGVWFLVFGVWFLVFGFKKASEIVLL